jgi:hypothetical protein
MLLFTFLFLTCEYPHANIHCEYQQKNLHNDIFDVDLVSAFKERVIYYGWWFY